MVHTDIKELYQGDIIRGGRLFYQKGELQSLNRLDDGSLVTVAAKDIDKTEQMSIVPSVLCDLVLLSQTCDIRKDEIQTIIVAPVFPFTKLAPKNQEICRKYKLTYAYYLPPTVINGIEYPESFIDIRFIATLDKDVLNDFDVVCHLHKDHANQFRTFIQVAFTREGFPDDVMIAMSKVSNEVRDSRNLPYIYGFYINWDEANIYLLAVLQENNCEVKARLERAVDKANHNASHFKIHLTARCKTEVTLADVEDYKRFEWDTLSFTTGTATDTWGAPIA